MRGQCHLYCYLLPRYLLNFGEFLVYFGTFCPENANVSKNSADKTSYISIFGKLDLKGIYSVQTFTFLALLAQILT